MTAISREWIGRKGGMTAVTAVAVTAVTTVTTQCASKKSRNAGLAVRNSERAPGTTRGSAGKRR